MAITDELRECIATAVWQYEDDVKTAYIPKDKLTAIADRIDERHERDLRESYDEGFASADDWLAQHEDAMEEHGWVKLPVDVDGVPIRIGDVLDEIAVATYPFVPAKVVGYHECCGEVLPIVENDGEFQVIPEKVCHHHAPTVEDVLDEFFGKANLPDGTQTRAEIIAEYAAKLRLAEEVDE